SGSPFPVDAWTFPPNEKQRRVSAGLRKDRAGERDGGEGSSPLLFPHGPKIRENYTVRSAPSARILRRPRVMPRAEGRGGMKCFIAGGGDQFFDAARISSVA